ncbi:MAG TPA: DegV family protein [Mycobacteriales bacterium]|nr:DegV family protein [Mycobacteriales bacterium]
MTSPMWSGAPDPAAPAAPRTVAVVTDSTAYLPPDVAQRFGIHVVPLHVKAGDRLLLEGIELLPDQFAKWITSPGRTASTQPPSVAEFKAAYDAIPMHDIVSIHLSGRLSGTREAAVSAAYELADAGRRRVKVVDSRQAAMGLGFAVIEAAQAAARGADLFDVAAAAEESARRTSMIFYVETLEYLRRGGRIGGAAALLGTALQMKPLLHLVNGTIEPMARVRGGSKALQRLEDTIVEEAGSDSIDVCIHHLAAQEGADALGSRLRSRLPGLEMMYQSEVGAVIGAHVGPGLLGAVLHRR